MARVLLKGIRKKYPNMKTYTIQGVDLEIKDKEFMIFVGPSGCGKSTLLRMIAGLSEITEGELYIGEKLVNKLPGSKRNIAMVFQDYALYPHMTVYENIGFALAMKGVKKSIIDEKIKKAADILNLTPFLQRYPYQLSGGQKQRVALGRAIVREPAAFLMDEPLSNLDAKLRVKMRTEILKLHHSLETTFIYVTHDQVEAMTMGTRIAIMYKGIMQQCDTPENVYFHPKNKFVAGFIGTPPMNFFTTTVKSDEKNNLYLVNPAFKLKVPDKKNKKLISFENKEVILGVRPEYIYPAETKDKTELKANVKVIEPLGSEKYILFEKDNIEFIAKFNSRIPATLNETIPIEFDKDMIHVFDIKTEENLFFE